jgi:hypothetical protein
LAKVKPICGIHLRLVDALHLVFDRVFDGRNVHVRRIQNIEHGIERRRLTAPGRARDEDDARRLLERMMDALQLSPWKPSASSVNPSPGLAQEAHHDLLPEKGREYRDAEGNAVASSPS